MPHGFVYAHVDFIPSSGSMSSRFPSVWLLHYSIGSMEVVVDSGLNLRRIVYSTFIVIAWLVICQHFRSSGFFNLC